MSEFLNQLILYISVLSCPSFATRGYQTFVCNEKTISTCIKAISHPSPSKQMPKPVTRDIFTPSGNTALQMPRLQTPRCKRGEDGEYYADYSFNLSSNFTVNPIYFNTHLPLIMLLSKQARRINPKFKLKIRSPIKLYTLRRYWMSKLNPLCM